MKDQQIVLEKINYKFMNIYNAFDTINDKINNLNIKFNNLNEIVNIIGNPTYEKIYKEFIIENSLDMKKNKNLIFENNIKIFLRKGTYIVFEYEFCPDNYEKIDIDVVFRLKYFDNVKDVALTINYNRCYKIKFDFYLDYNVSNLDFKLYLNSTKDYYLTLWQYLNKILFYNKILKIFIYSKK